MSKNQTVGTRPPFKCIHSYYSAIPGHANADGGLDTAS